MSFSRFLKKTNFTSFDCSTSVTTTHSRPDRYRMLKDSQEIQQIARGAGLSYAPASFGKKSIVKEMICFDRLLEFDESTNVVVVESGISLYKLLKWCLNHKLFFPVLPGWPEITVGGCLAANVHGKNPSKDGTFMDHVDWFELFHPSFGSKIISRSNDRKIFDATCGGLGLTGIITKIALRLKELPSDTITITPKKSESINESLSILKINSDHDVLYSWHIGSTVHNFGKGIVRVGEFSEKSNIPKIEIPKIKNLYSRKKMPFSFWNNYSSAIINSLNRKIEIQKKVVKKDIFSGLFPFVEKAGIFYSMYGKNGFNEYQILVEDKHAEEFLKDLTLLIKSKNPSLTFLFMKIFKGQQKLLQFSGNGVSVILNLKHNNSTLNFLKTLDELIISYKALPYIIKDSRLSKNVVEQCYPEYFDFKEIIKEIDPKRIFKSEISERLNI
jgi:decaprenylphospho-beta-D-ribofuranose 2-oxidase